MNFKTRKTNLANISLLSYSIYSQPVLAQEDDSAELTTIINAIAVGWEQADGTPFRENFLDFEGARYIE